MFKTFKGKLLTVFLLFTTLCVLIIIFRTYVSHKKDKIRQAQHLLHCINESNLRKFNAIADFFSLETRNIKFFKTGKSPILLKIDSLSKTIDKQIEIIEGNEEIIEEKEEITDFNLNSIIIGILRKLNQHISVFDDILKFIKMRGFGDYGYIGMMRQNLYNLEAHTKLDMSLILTLKRNEKDYMLRYENRYIDSLKSHAEQMKNEIAANLKLSRAEKDSCIFYLKNYVAYFDTMTLMDRQIGIKDNSALYLRLNQIEDNLQSDFSELLEKAFRRQNRLLENLNLSFSGFSILLVLLSVFLSYYLSKRLSDNSTDRDKKNKKN